MPFGAISFACSLDQLYYDQLVALMQVPSVKAVNLPVETYAIGEFPCFMRGAFFFLVTL